MSNRDVRVNFEETLTVSGQATQDLLRKGTTDVNGIETRRYAPFKNFSIHNNGSTDLKVFFNQQLGSEDIPAGTVRIFKDENVSFYKLVNRSGSTTGSARVTLDNQDTELSLLKQLVAKR